MNIDVEKIITGLLIAAIIALSGTAFNLHQDVQRLKLENELSDKVCMISCDQLEVEKLKMMQIIDKQYYKYKE